MAAYEGPPDLLARYEQVVESAQGIERKGAKMPYTSRNGHMFSFLDPTGSMALRLLPEAREEFLSRYPSRVAHQHGHALPEYVVVPDALLDRTNELRPWLVRSHEWIGTLKPKPATRRPRS
jgi:hypothetical protein